MHKSIKTFLIPILIESLRVSESIKIVTVVGTREPSPYIMTAQAKTKIVRNYRRKLKYYKFGSEQIKVKKVQKCTSADTIFTYAHF